MLFFLAVLLHLPAILMFHQVDEHVPAGAVSRALTVSPAQLSSELDYLESRRLRAVSVDDYLQAIRENRSTRDMVILTFDDGYVDQYTQALPVLLRHHAHATFFITTGNVGRRNHVTWPEIEDMAKDGMSIGGHSVQHVDLAKLTIEAQRAEIEGCLAALRMHGVYADTYAYPGGTFNRATEMILAKEPVALAFTTDPSHEIGVQPRFEIPRLRVKNVTTIAELSREMISPPIAIQRTPHE